MAKTAKELYNSLAREREPFLERAREAANYTLPHLMLREGDNSYSDLSRNYQSVGSTGIVTLASKMLRSLFPTSQPNFQLKTDVFAVSKLEAEQGGANLVNELKANLARVEQAVMNEFDSKGLRPMLNETLKQLLVAGNVMINLPEDGSMKVYRMDSYVVKRDHQGSPIMMVIKEKILREDVPESIEHKTETEDVDLSSTVDVYTKISKDPDDDVWHIVQEIMGQEIEETRGQYVDEPLPYIPLRLEPITGMDWGWGYVTQLIGDLITYEGMTQALTEASVAASKVVFLVSPSAIGTDARTIAEAPNGAFVEGRSDDISIVTLGSKAADMSIAFQTSNGIKERLEKAFLLNSSFQRSQDRVTATEIQLMAEELETVLAGTYSLLSVEFQLPLIELVMSRMQKEGRLPEIPEDLVLPTITTGLNALGRGSELSRLDSFIGGANAVLGQTAMQYLDVSNYLDRRLTALGLLNNGLLKTKEQLQAEAQAQQNQALVDKFGGTVVNQALKEEEE